MWQDDQDTNEDGVPVRLYQPILYSGRAADTNNPTVSHVGGTPAYFDAASNIEMPVCQSCGDTMYLLLQLYTPETERTLHVFGCNRGACVASLFETSQFSVGGGGRFVCRHSKPSETVSKEETTRNEETAPSQTVVESAWTNDEKDDAENDWNVTDDNTEDVEAMLAAMEMEGTKAKVSKTKTSHTSKAKSNNITSSFSCFEIHGLQEPPEACKNDDMDDDDVGMMGNDDKKIQEMLAKYMEEEEDEYIIAAIQGASSIGGGGPGEQDERLPPEDRALLTFTDRVKRAPRQIVRYAKGGLPLWSVPMPEQERVKVNSGQSAGIDDDETNESTSQFDVPKCSCGAPRQFECQLLPNLLGVLDVDKHARAKQNKSSSHLTIHELMSREYGGMNWGAVAVYSCKDNCNTCVEDFCIVQDSIDGNPEKRAGPTDDAMVVDNDKEEENDGECIYASV